MDKVIGTITIIAAILVSSIASRYVFKRIRSNAAKSASSLNHDNIIRQPRMYLYVGVGFIVFCLLVIFVAAFAPALGWSEPGYVSERMLCVAMFLLLSIPAVYIVVQQVNWRIEVGEDSFSYTNIWRKTSTYEFSGIAFRDTPSAIDVIDKNAKMIVRISLLLENVSCLRDAFRKWEKANKVKKQRPTRNLTFRYGTYARNFGIAFLVIGLFFIALTALFDSSVEEDIISLNIIYVLIGITFPVGIMSLLLYKVWKIEIINDKFIFRNFLGITRIYELSEISEKNNAKTTEYFHGKKRIVRVWDYIIG